MELIKETNGWKLLREPRLHKYEIVSPEGFKTTSNRIVFLINEFDRIVERGWIWIDVEYFTAQIENSEIVTQKQKRQIQSDKYDKFVNTNNFLTQSHYMTVNEAKEKLQSVLAKAKKKYELCKEKFLAIQDEFDFEVEHQMLGDTHGIYEDYLYIGFKIDGIFCKFDINN